MEQLMNKKRTSNIQRPMADERLFYGFSLCCGEMCRMGVAQRNPS